MGLFYGLVFVEKVMGYIHNLNQKIFKGEVFDCIFVVGIAAFSIGASLLVDHFPE
jgi:hypothetical protein